MSLAELIKAAQLPPPSERRSIRERSGATLREVARELGVTPLTVSRWEQGLNEPRRHLAIAYRQLLEALEEVTR